MASPYDARLSGILKNSVTVVLKPLGFRKQGNAFVRQLDDLSWIVEVQKSLWNSKEKAEFTLNCGVSVPDLFATYGNRPEPKGPLIGRCCLHVRIGHLADRRDTWWTLRAYDDVAQVDERIAADLRDRLERSVLPFLNRFQTRRNVICYLEAPRPREEESVWPRSEVLVLAYLGILYWLQGDQEQCAAVLARADAIDTGTGMDDHIHCLRTRLSRQSTV